VTSQYPNPVLIYQGGQRIVFKVNHPEFGSVAQKSGRYKMPNNPDGWDIERNEGERSPPTSAFDQP